MTNVTSLAIDLAKHSFQLHGTDRFGNAILKKKISRGKLKEYMVNLKPCSIYMEGCGSANYWGSCFERMGHQVRLINPKYVKPYIKRNKNDVNDAAGIAAAARDPDMRFSKVKTEVQQDIQSLHRIRSLLVQQRTGLINQIRGLLLERGIIIAQTPSRVYKILPEVLDNENLSVLMHRCFKELYENLKYLKEKVKGCDKMIKELFESDETCKRLSTIPGVGILGATILF